MEPKSINTTHKPPDHTSPGDSAMLSNGTEDFTDTDSGDFVVAQGGNVTLQPVERMHFVFNASTLLDALEDESKNTEINVRRYTESGIETIQSTEHHMLVELDYFLRDALDKTQDANAPELAAAHNKAQQILDSLTYIGDSEVNTALDAIAESWKQYLREDGQRQIFVYTGVENKYSYDEPIPEEPPVKSDRYLLDRLLGTFTDEEFEEFSGRLVLDPSDLSADPEKTRVIIFDDWSVSGSQLAMSLGRVRDGVDPSYENSIEIQLLTATQSQVEKIESYDGARVNAYYKANSVVSEHPDDVDIVVAGLHSTADYGFASDLRDIAWQLLLNTPGYVKQPGDYSRLQLPLIVKAISPYRRLKQDEMVNYKRLSTAS